jgi:hypothetical protein
VFLSPLSGLTAVRARRCCFRQQQVVPVDQPLRHVIDHKMRAPTSNQRLCGRIPAPARHLRSGGCPPQVNAVCARLTELSTGVAGALSDAPQSREFYKHQLQSWLSLLQQAFTELDKEP